MTQTAVATEPITETYDRRVRHLSEASVEKHWEAYADIDWDALAAESFHDDNTQWKLPKTDPLHSHPWYLAQSPETQAKIVKWRVVSHMRVGIEFENTLSRGLLSLALREPTGSKTFRYAYHEMIEEGQHTLMFQEFVNRSGLKPQGMPWLFRIFVNFFVHAVVRYSPERFFYAVLAGEEPVDYLQRRALRDEKPLPPLLERIFQIHVSEEARHVAFAHVFLKKQVAQLGWFRRKLLTYSAPLIVAQGAHLMMDPPREWVTRCGVPESVIREAYGKNPEWQKQIANSVRRIRDFTIEIGLMPRGARRLWQRLGVWAETEA